MASLRLLVAAAAATLLLVTPVLAAAPTLAAGDRAPDFALLDIDGKRQSLAQQRGHKVLVCFFRYAACIFCNLRNHDMVERFPAWQAKGVTVLAFFESPAQSVRDYVGKQGLPYPLLADPTREVYARYGVTATDDNMMGHALGRPGDLWRGNSLGFMKNNPEGEQKLLPAEFMIGADGRIHEAYYGKDIGDHVPFERVDAFAGVVR